VQCDGLQVGVREENSRANGKTIYPEMGVGFSYPLSALRVVEKNRTERKTSASGLRRDAKDITEAQFDSVDTAVFARPAILQDHVICAAAAVRERVKVLRCVLPRLSTNISC